MFDYKKIFRNREFRLKIINCLRFIPNTPYLHIVYLIKTGKILNLKKPQTFCDKLNWLKLNNINPEYTKLVDKIAVRDYLIKKIGKDICIPLLGTYNCYEDIDFDRLPDKFVIKCSHDSGSTKIIQDKALINHKELSSFFNNRLRQNPYFLGREYPYKDVIPRICIEEYMVSEENSDLNDYKFFCFDGKPEILFIATERSSNCKFDFYDMDFNHLDIINIHPQSNLVINKPINFEQMKELVSNLSEGMKFVRIDLYEINGKIYFGEFTFFHAGGFWPMKPDEWEIKLGNLISIK